MRPRVRKKRQETSTRRKWLIILAAAISLTIAGVIWDLHREQPKLAEVSAVQKQPPLSSLQCTERLPLNVLVGQVLMVGLPADEMAGQVPLFKQYHVGGAVLMTAPANPDDGSIKAFKRKAASIGVPVLTSTDEEGGDIQRFSALGTLPSPRRAAETLTLSQVQQLIARHAAKLKSAGLDMILGPLADVAPQQGQSPLGDRIFSNDPKIVSDYALAYVQGWQTAGLLPTLKHFPGMGSASANTDYEPATTPPLTLLKQRDFTPYRSLTAAGAAVMVGNQSVPDWFGGPASLNPVVNRYLRQTLGFENNLVITDSLAAKAITNFTTIPDAVVEAISAGNDMVIIVSPEVGTITAAANKKLIRDSETALQRAIQSGSIIKQQLSLAVMRKLAAQNISPCTL